MDLFKAALRKQNQGATQRNTRVSTPRGVGAGFAHQFMTAIGGNHIMESPLANEIRDVDFNVDGGTSSSRSSSDGKSDQEGLNASTKRAKVPVAVNAGGRKRLSLDDSSGEEEESTSDKRFVREEESHNSTKKKTPKKKNKRTLPVVQKKSKKKRMTTSPPKERIIGGPKTTGLSDEENDDVGVGGDDADGLPVPVTPHTPVTSSPSRAATAEARSAAKKKARQPPIKKGMRVKARRSQLFHCLSANQQKYLPRSHPNYQNY